MGRTRDYPIAGIGLGLACATKYTGGIMLLPLLCAAGIRIADRETRGPAIRGVVFAGMSTIAGFLVAVVWTLGGAGTARMARRARRKITSWPAHPQKSRSASCVE